MLRERGQDQGEALRITEAALGASVVSGGRSMSWLGKPRLAFSALRLMVRKVMEMGYPAKGWETEWVEVGPKVVAFDIHRCFYLDMLTEYGAPELTASFCASDDSLYQDLWPGVTWGRTMTLGRGNPACNFRFERVDPRSRGASAVAPHPWRP